MRRETPVAGPESLNSLHRVEFRQVSHFVYSITNKNRRLHWTAEEEEMRKEGVDKFSTKIIKNLSWKKVLEFGRVFYPTCTPSDLKDKRRNITAKKSSAISRRPEFPVYHTICVIIQCC